MFDSKMGTRMLRRSSRARRLIRVGASCIELFVLICRPRPRVCSGVEGLVGGEQRELNVRAWIAFCVNGRLLDTDI